MDETVRRTQKKQILVGVAGSRTRHVVATAAWYAENFDAELTCAAIDADPFTMGETPSGYLVTMADLTPEQEEERSFGPDLVAMIDSVTGPRGIVWHERLATGRPAPELSDMAEELDALMIVLGTREGMRGALREALNGSVAAQLAHRQHRPVVVVPLDPITEGDAKFFERLEADRQQQAGQRAQQAASASAEGETAAPSA